MIDPESLLYDLIDLSLEGEKGENLLREQFDVLILKEEHYTGSGVFYYFEITEEQRKFRLHEKDRLHPYSATPSVISNLELINKELDLIADVLLHIENGLLSYLEVWNKTGSDYPKAALLSYQLKRY